MSKIKIDPNQRIVIKGAREHNLKNVDLVLPRNKLIVMTGLSGSGKSSLAFDTIYADGQRRYMESLSSYARQFLGQMEKPDVDEITGLSPAISIDQKTTSHNPRSTVGTVTEIYDYLRLMYARIGVPHCPVCGRVISQQTRGRDGGRGAEAARTHPVPGAGPGGAGPQGHPGQGAGRRPARRLCAGAHRRQHVRPGRGDQAGEKHQAHRRDRGGPPCHQRQACAAAWPTPSRRR